MERYNDGRDLYVKRPDEDARREERGLERKRDRDMAIYLITDLIYMAIRTAGGFDDNSNAMVGDFVNNVREILRGKFHDDDPEAEDCEDREDREDREDVRSARRIITKAIDSMCTVTTNYFSDGAERYSAVVNYLVWDFLDSMRSKLTEWVIRVPPPSEE